LAKPVVKQPSRDLICLRLAKGSMVRIVSGEV
jgi:hypothetical protein